MDAFQQGIDARRDRHDRYNGDPYECFKGIIPTAGANSVLWQRGWVQEDRRIREELRVADLAVELTARAEMWGMAA